MTPHTAREQHPVAKQHVVLNHPQSSRYELLLEEDEEEEEEGPGLRPPERKLPKKPERRRDEENGRGSKPSKVHLKTTL